jgi:excisionase family DNA binding protein
MSINMESTERSDTSDQYNPVQLVRAEKVAALLDVSRTKVFELIGSGELRSVKIGGSRRIPLSAIEEYLTRHTIEKRTSG